MSFVDAHGLWSTAQQDAAREMARRIEADGLEVVRFSSPDQHGILRGKTLVADEAVRVLRDGVSFTSTLLTKNTAHRTVKQAREFGLTPKMKVAPLFVQISDVHSLSLSAPIQDPLFGTVTIRVDRRSVHDIYLYEVKAPAESKGTYDDYKLPATVPADQAFRPLADGGCPLAAKNEASQRHRPLGGAGRRRTGRRNSAIASGQE